MERITDHLRTGSAHEWTPRKTNYDPEFTLHHIQREILTYLGNSPRRLREMGSEGAGDLALSLGNCLNWICSSLDGENGGIAQPLDESPQSVYALGKQLQEVGRNLLGKPKAGNLNARLDRLEKLMEANLAMRTEQPESVPPVIPAAERRVA